MLAHISMKDELQKKPEPVDVTTVIGLLDAKSCNSCRRLLTCKSQIIDDHGKEILRYMSTTTSNSYKNITW